MRSVNKAIIVGKLGRDAETKFLSTGTAKTTFSVATDRSWKDKTSGEFKKETDWHNIILWQNEKIVEYLKKGTAVYIEGRISNRSYDKDGEKRYISEIVCEEVILLGGGEQRGVGSSTSRSSDPAPKDDDIPW